MKRVLVGFLVYGVAVGILSVWWWHLSDMPFLPNIPGVLLGDAVYEASINSIGNPNSSQAHYTIPFFLRKPEVYLPVSAALWGLIGAACQIVLDSVVPRLCRGRRAARGRTGI